MRLQEITLRTVRLPLIRPYVLSYRTFTEFEPIIVQVRDSDGRIGWGEGHISPGSSLETREGGWAFCREHAAAVIGKDTREAKAIISANVGASKVAATALLTAIEMLEDHPLLKIDREVRLPLLTPFNSSTPDEIGPEVERRLDDGFRTFKIKVGKDPADDLQRVQTIQRAIGGRATMRIDANRAFSEGDACRFAVVARSFGHRAVRAALPPPRIGTPTPMSRKSPPCRSCWTSRSASSRTSGAPRPFRMSASASSS